MKKLVIDLDSTITLGDTSDYRNVSPNLDVIARLFEYREQGFTITVFTARNMRTYDGNIGLINIHTLPLIIAWLDRHSVPYDEVIVGKPWCGHQGFYVDDRAVRPSEFANLSFEELCLLLDEEKIC